MPDGNLRPTEATGCQSMGMLAATGGGEEHDEWARIRAMPVNNDRREAAFTIDNAILNESTQLQSRQPHCNNAIGRNGQIDCAIRSDGYLLLVSFQVVDSLCIPEAQHLWGD